MSESRGREGKSNKKGTTDGYRVTNATLGMENNASLAYALELELHHPITSKIGGHRRRLEREKYASCDVKLWATFNQPVGHNSIG